MMGKWNRVSEVKRRRQQVRADPDGGSLISQAGVHYGTALQIDGRARQASVPATWFGEWPHWWDTAPGPTSRGVPPWDGTSRDPFSALHREWVITDQPDQPAGSHLEPGLYQPAKSLQTQVSKFFSS